MVNMLDVIAPGSRPWKGLLKRWVLEWRIGNVRLAGDKGRGQLFASREKKEMKNTSRCPDEAVKEEAAPKAHTSRQAQLTACNMNPA